MIYTGRYQYRLSDELHYAVRTTRGAPRFPLSYTLRHDLWPIAPLPPLMGLDAESFRSGYYDQLDRIGVDRVIKMLDGLERDAMSRDVVLLCFCGKKHDYCHRHVFADWLHERAGVRIHELRAPLR